MFKSSYNVFYEHVGVVEILKLTLGLRRDHLKWGSCAELVDKKLHVEFFVLFRKNHFRNTTGFLTRIITLRMLLLIMRVLPSLYFTVGKL